MVGKGYRSFYGAKHGPAGTHTTARTAGDGSVRQSQKTSTNTMKVARVFVGILRRFQDVVARYQWCSGCVLKCDLKRRMRQCDRCISCAILRFREPKRYKGKSLPEVTRYLVARQTMIVECNENATAKVIYTTNCSRKRYIRTLCSLSKDKSVSC